MEELLLRGVREGAVRMERFGDQPQPQLASTRLHAQMKRPVADMGGLDARMAEAGDNLSAGQRQLFCLAR